MYGIALITCPHDDVEKIAKRLLDSRLAAGINIITTVTSRFWWKDTLESRDEVLLVVKTRVNRFDELNEAVKTVHSYEVPGIILLPIIDGNSDYLQWIDQEVKE